MGSFILQLVYHREQINIEHADIVVDEQAAIYREVIAAECRHDVPDARCDFAAAVNGRGRIERSESGDFVDESVENAQSGTVYSITAYDTAGNASQAAEITYQ